MKQQFNIFILCILSTQFSLAQNAKDLSHTEIDSLLNLYESNEEHNKGIKLAIAASNKSGKQDSLCGEYLSWIAYFYELEGDKEKAIEYYDKTLSVFAQTLGQNTARYAETLNYFGIFQQSIGNYEQALPLYVQAKNIQREVLGKESPDLANSLNNLANLQESMGNYEQALPLYIQAKNIRQKALGKEHPAFATSLNNLAVLYKRMGNYEQALPLYIQTKNIREKILGKEHPYFARALNNLAALYLQMGNYAQALPLYIQAKNIFEKVLGSEHPSFATSLNNLAVLYQKMENYEQALVLYVQAKNIREKALGKEHPAFATSLNNLASLHREMKDYDEALNFYIQAKNIREKVLGKEHPTYARLLNNLAFLYEKVGNYELALPLYIQAKNIRENALGTDHPDFASSLNNLAQLHQKMGNYEQAWDLLFQAFNSSSTINIRPTIDRLWLDSLKMAPFPSNSHLDRMIISLGTAYRLLQKDSAVANSGQKQILVADLTLSLLTKTRNQVTNEDDKLRMLAQSNDWLQKSLAVLTPSAHSHKAFNLSDQNKSVLLLQATKSEQAYRLGELPDSLVWADKKLLKKQSQLEAMLMENRTKAEKDSLRNELNHVNQDINAFAKTIEQSYPKYHKLKYKQNDVKGSDIQKILEKDDALLEYVIGDSVVHIFYVDKKEVQWSKTFVANNELRGRIRSLHEALSNYEQILKNPVVAYQEYTNQAYWFYQNLLAPALKDKSNIKNLILVTDGELGHLPFETFLLEQAPQELTDYSQLHYLVTDYNISYNYSASLWKENKEADAPNNNGQMLGIAANYGIKLDSAMLEVRLPTDQSLRGALSPLPAAREEVEMLQERFKGFFAFDELASEKTVKEKAADYAILHFATHGILDAKRPVLSSLAFTENGDSVESNFWQAHEISKIKLNADLVVLSACETGYGRFEAGNGIASLARAFMYAGSPALVVSLWQVNDQATSRIMENFYTNLANNMKKDEALRQAKLQYMKAAEGIAAHPAFWSPFIMMGKTDVIKIQRKGDLLSTISSPLGLGIGATVLTLLGVGVFLRRRKREV